MKNIIMDMSFLRNLFRYFSMMAFLAICGSSWQDIDIIDENDPARIGDNIRFEVSTEKKTLTVKSEQEKQELEPIVLVSENDSITLMLYPSITPIREQDEIMTTKSEKVTSKNITDKSIQLTALCADYVADSPIIPSTPLIYDSWKVQDNISIWKTNPEYQWPSSAIRFFAWSPAENVNLTNGTFDGVNGVMSFHYSMPEPSEDHNDAVNQPDIVFANVESSVRNGLEVPLVFDHMLSAIRFEVGKTNDLQIVSISLKNVLSSGTCRYEPGVVDASVVWSELSDPKDYMQVYDSVDGLIREDLAYKPGTGTPQTIGRESKTFMVIPQTSTESSPIILEVVILLKGTETPITLTSVLSSEMASWLAGFEYKYTLNTTNGLDIEIDDSVTDNVKSNLTITNIGGKDAYVRVLIVGNWVNADGDIVATWDPSDETMGVFSPKIFAATPVLNENWVKGADGFYYYTKVLPAGAVTQTKLFDSYVVNEAGKPKGLKLSDHLEIDIVTQAVIVDQDKAAITTAWGATAAGYVEEMPTE